VNFLRDPENFTWNSAEEKAEKKQAFKDLLRKSTITARK
jgi:hypothetical protein